MLHFKVYAVATQNIELQANKSLFEIFYLVEEIYPDKLFKQPFKIANISGKGIRKVLPWFCF